MAIRTASQPRHLHKCARSRAAIAAAFLVVCLASVPAAWGATQFTRREAEAPAAGTALLRSDDLHGAGVAVQAAKSVPTASASSPHGVEVSKVAAGGSAGGAGRLSVGAASLINAALGAKRPSALVAGTAVGICALVAALLSAYCRWNRAEPQSAARRGLPPGSSKDAAFKEDASIWGALGYASAWMALSASLTLHNAWMFSSVGGRFPFVTTLTCYHMGLNTLLSLLVYALCPSLMPAATRLPMPAAAVARAVAVPAALLTTTLALGNRAYLYLSVSLIQMVKAGMPMLVYLVSCLAGVEALSLPLVGAIVVIFLGVAMTVMGELRLDPTGLLILGVSSVAESCRLVSLKLMLSSRGIQLDPLSGLLFYAPMCFVALFMVGLVTGEFWRLPALAELPKVQLAINGTLACGLNLASVFLLQRASATTLTVCGVMKDAGIVALSLLLLQNSITPMQVFGFVITVGAVRAYNNLKERAGK